MAPELRSALDLESGNLRHAFPQPLADLEEVLHLG
jgi:hypothetical protein